MVGIKSLGYSNSGRLSDGEYSMPFFCTRHSPTCDCGFSVENNFYFLLEYRLLLKIGSQCL